MPGRAAGFRASDSVAAAVAFACPSPQIAEAMAMANPAVIATHLLSLADSAWAYKGVASNIPDSAMNSVRNFCIVFLPLMNCCQWVVDVILVQTPSRSQRKG